MKVLAFALGNIWKWTKLKNRDVLFKYVKNLEVDGVEVTFASREELDAFHISSENRKWLRKQKYVSIHAPFNILRASKSNKDYRKQLLVIDKIYKDINAQNVIIHPTEIPRDPNIFKGFEFNISTENLPPIKEFNVVNLRDIFKRFPQMGLCIDVAHAYLWSRDMTKRLIKKFGDRVTQIHLSGTYRRRDHQSLQVVTSNFIKSIKPIHNLNIPIVIEETFQSRSIKLLQDEVNYIKEHILNGYKVKLNKYKIQANARCL